MKKLIAILLVAFLAVSSSYAVDYASMTAHGAGGQGTNDLSYDETTGLYTINVTCEMTICTENGDIDLGYINPDGSRYITSAEDMVFQVTGANGWFFEAWVGADQFSNESNEVYFVGQNWSFEDLSGNTNGTANNNMSGLLGTYGTTGSTIWKHAVGMQLSNCQDCTPGANCNGVAVIKFHPNRVVATEYAAQGAYTWDVYASADYMSWLTPVNPDGSAYVSPGV